MPQEKSKATVAHLIATNFVGGPEKQILTHLGLLKAQRYRAILVSFVEHAKKNMLLTEAARLNLEHFGIPMSGPLDLRAWFALRRIVIEQNIDLICAHGYKSSVMSLCLHCLMKIRVLGFSRGYTAENPTVAFYEWLDRHALRYLDGVICVSEGQRSHLERFGVEPRKCWVVHNAVSLPPQPLDNNLNRKQIYDLFSLPKTHRLIVCAGRLSPEKGQADLLRAISLLRGKGKDCTFVFCGDGPSRSRLEKIARELNIWDRVRFVGFRKDLPQIFEVMDLLVLPSHTEGLPNVVLEAFSFGKPTVATRVGGVPEVIEHGRNGILVPPKRPDMLADAMEECLASPDKMASMGREGRDIVLSKFSFAEQSRQLESIYMDILSPRSPGKSQELTY